MLKATQKTQCEQHTVEQVLPEEESDINQEVIIILPPAVTSTFIAYIEGRKMDWSVNDSLYNRFLKWKIKCENILECELAMPSESRKCIMGPTPRRGVLGSNLEKV